MKLYSEYSSDSFLNDNMFIDSVMRPNYELDSYWNSLLDNGALNIREYTDAFLALFAWKQSSYIADEKTLDALWERIDRDCRCPKPVEKKSTSWLFTAAVSVSATLAVVLMLVFFSPGMDRKAGEDIEVASDFRILNMAQDADNIMIVSEQNTLLLDGNYPDICYDAQGNIVINNAEIGQTSLAGDNYTIIVPFGKIAKMELGDGSRLWINSGSSVAYPKTFSGDRREITVDGEIYAEIAHDGRPFIVHSDGMDVLVKGTSFDVSSYQADDFSRVILVEGSVEVRSESDCLTLEPFHSYTLGADGSKLQEVDTDLYTSWINSIYKFEDAPLEDVLLKLARFYNISIVLPKRPSGVICYGSLELKDDVGSILKGLMQIASFNYVIKDKVYYIKFN